MDNELTVFEQIARKLAVAVRLVPAVTGWVVLALLVSHIIVEPLIDKAEWAFVQNYLSQE